MLHSRPCRDAGRRRASGRSAPGAALRRLRDDRGNASLEFLGAGVVLLVPLVYLVLAVSQIQAGALAVEGAARQAARVLVAAPDLASGQDSAELALAFALEDHGLGDVDASLALACDPEPCLERGGLVHVTVAAEVPLPLVPPFVQSTLPVTVPLEAVASQRVSRFAGAGS